MKIRLLFLLALLAIPSFAIAAGQDEPVIYVIKKGDTLWGLSERFIKDPKYWPSLWSKNSQVTNPHFIYPGQKLRIYPDRLEFVPKAQEASITKQSAASASSSSTTETLKEAAADKTYTLYGTEGFLAEKGFKPGGMLIGGQNERIVAGVDDIVYTDIGSSQNAAGGDKFLVFRKDASVKHPVNNEEMGYKMIPLGTLQLTDVERKSSRAIITKSYREISPGAYLLPYKDNRKTEIEMKIAKNDLKGYLLESYSGASVIATGDIVYIDLGTSQGAAIGNMLYIVRDVTIDQRYVEGRIDRLPQELLGALVILDTGKNTSTALVVKSIDTIYKGDRIVSQPK
jgi:LysM repeat protein